MSGAQQPVLAVINHAYPTGIKEPNQTRAPLRILSMGRIRLWWEKWDAAATVGQSFTLSFLIYQTVFLAIRQTTIKGCALCDSARGNFNDSQIGHHLSPRAKIEPQISERCKRQVHVTVYAWALNPRWFVLRVVGMCLIGCRHTGLGTLHLAEA